MEKKMTALICGSFAYDIIMTFDDQFKRHLLPDQLHKLNVSFLVSNMKKQFGGCAGNIAYNLNLLGQKCIPMGTVGQDFSDYANWMDHCGIARDFVVQLSDTYTAQAYITTDSDGNQITMFHPGAMNFSHQNQVNQASDVSIGIVSPDGRQGMIDHSQQFASSGIPFIFDPGQGMPMFGKNELDAFIEQATWITLNDYEFELLQEKTGKNLSQIVDQVEALIVTLGGEGSRIYSKSKTIEIPSVKPSQISDPTGCGDAYRAGLIFGLTHQMDWETTGRIASLMGSIKIEHHGTQNHSYDFQSFADRFKKQFNYSI